MPYNTRRKSLSLAELGILPKRSRATSHSIAQPIADADERPVKKNKTSHGPSESSSPVDVASGGMSPPSRSASALRIGEEKLRHQQQHQALPSRPAVAQLSPPPSPLREGDGKIDTEGINDDIVVGTIEQLQKTGNRPHLVKELAAVLASSIPAVDRSANPSALISSRLAAYLHRQRPAFTPCPVAKLIEPVHPRRLYFYLTTMPRQPLPEPSDTRPNPIRITPSLSSTGDIDEEDEEEEARYNRVRTALSPSPEIDLSSPDLEEDMASETSSPSGSFSARNSIPREHPPASKNLAHNRRAVSPQLEPEERTFKQTANQLYQQAQQRQNSIQDINMDSADTTAGATPIDDTVAMSVEPAESEESTALKNQQAAAELFDQPDYLKNPTATIDMSSPMILPQTAFSPTTAALHTKPDRRDEVVEYMNLDLAVGAKNELPDPFAWDTLQSPENIELAELEDMFDTY